MKAVILAAGEGTRLRPVTYYTPKPMLPFYGKSFMAYTLRNLAGLVEGLVIVVSYRQEQVRDYFGDRFASLPVEYVTQQDLRGTGAAVMAARDSVDGRFLVIQGDVYASRKLLQDMIDIDDQYALSLVEVDDPENHAGVRHQHGTVKETLTPNHWVDRGVWLLSSSIFDPIQEISSSKNTHEVRMLAVIQELISNGVDILAHRTYEPWIELGDHAPLESVLKALEFLGRKSGLGDSSVAPEVEIENSKIKNSLLFGSGKIIESRIENCVIYLRGTVEDQDVVDRIDVLGSRGR